MQFLNGYFLPSLTLASLVVVTIFSSGCSRSPVVTISNRSGIAVSNVVLSGSGFTNRTETIVPGAERKLVVHPRGESGLRVVFDAAGRKVDSGEQGYFEAGGGYHASAIIDTNLNVSVSDEKSAY